MRVQAVGLGWVFAVQSGNVVPVPGMGLVSATLCLALGGARRKEVGYSDLDWTDVVWRLVIARDLAAGKRRAREDAASTYTAPSAVLWWEDACSTATHTALVGSHHRESDDKSTTFVQPEEEIKRWASV